MLRYEHQGIRVASKATVQPRLHNKTFMEELSRLKKKVLCILRRKKILLTDEDKTEFWL